MTGKSSGGPATHRDLDQIDYERLAEFRYLLRQFLLFSEAAAERAGLTPQQHQALLAIRGVAGRSYLTTGELAERLGIRHHSAVGLVDRLVSKRLVTRRSSTEDRRKVHIHLAPAAEAVLLELSLVHRTELARLAPVLRTLLRQLGRDATRNPGGRSDTNRRGTAEAAPKTRQRR